MFNDGQFTSYELLGVTSTLSEVTASQVKVYNSSSLKKYRAYHTGKLAYFDNHPPPPKSILKDLPPRSNSKSVYSFLFMVIIYCVTGNKLPVS